MKRSAWTSLILLFSAVSAFAEDTGPGFSNETVAGVVMTRGNSDTTQVELGQTNVYHWTSSFLTFKASYLKASDAEAQLAKHWSLGLRFDDLFTDTSSAFIAETLRAAPFTGYTQRYHSDIGARQILTKTEWSTWAAEAGYRYTIQNENSGNQRTFHYLRAYTELSFPWSWRASALLWAEFLPNLTQTDFWQLNGSAALDAYLTEILSMRLSYVLRYSHTTLPGALHNTDTIWITSIVVRW